MATGYTYGVVEGKFSFEEFVWRCARGFGAFMHMRDMDSDAKLHYPPKDTFYTERLNEVKRELAEALNRTKADWVKTYKADYATTNTANKEISEAWKLENKRLNTMITEVDNWKVPNDSFTEMKKFMASQLETSLHRDTNYLEVPRKKVSIEDYIDSEIKMLTRRVAYSEESVKDAEARYQSHIKFIDELRASVPVPKHLDGF